MTPQATLAGRRDRWPTDGRRGLPVVLLAGGLVGLVAAFVLSVEKVRLLTDPFHVPSCTLNATFNCGSVMSSAQAEAFGFPNSFLGLVGFSVVAATGAALLAGARLAGWFWAGLQAGVTLGVVFVHWLFFQSVFVLGALCPYCMAVWAATILVFWYVTLRNASVMTGHGRGAAVLDGLARYHSSIIIAWALALGVLTWMIL